MLKMRLQLFAEDTAAAAAAASSADNSTAKATEPTSKEPAPAATLKPQEAKYTDDDVNKLIDQKFAEWQKKQEKAVTEAKKLAEMNATQKAEYQRDQLQKELDALKKQAALSEMMKTSRKMLSENGITISDDLLSMLVNEDAEATKASVDGFASAFAEAVEAAVKERLKGESPRKSTGSVTAMTKEQIMAIKDPVLRQQKILENKELFNF